MGKFLKIVVQLGQVLGLIATVAEGVKAYKDKRKAEKEASNVK